MKKKYSFTLIRPKAALNTYKRFIFFCIVGVSNTVVDLVVFISLISGFEYFAANILYAHGIAFFISSTQGFVLNKYITFKSHAKSFSIAYCRYIAASIFGLMLSSLLLYTFVTNGNLSPIPAKLLVTSIMAGIMYVIHKTWSFK